MTEPLASITCSTFNRLPLWRRTLWGVAARPPSVPFEFVACDDGSDEPVLDELRSYSAQFPWTFVRFAADRFEEATGLKKFLNNSSVTSNIATRHARGSLIFQQGNEVIPTEGCYDKLLGAGRELATRTPHWLVVSTTYDVPPEALRLLDSYGTNLGAGIIAFCSRWPLQSRSYRSDVTNYISLAPRALWEKLGGYDERYYQGISAEDSDFVRRARAIPGFEMAVVDDAISLHQFHNGKTAYYEQSASYCTKERWAEGARLNRVVYDSWDGTHENRQGWGWGAHGAGEILKNWS